MTQYDDLRALATRWYRTQSEVVLDDQLKSVIEFIEWLETNAEEQS